MEKISELTGKLGVWGSLGAGMALATLLFAGGYIYLLGPFQETIRISQTEAENKEKQVAQLKVLAENQELVEKNGAEIYANYLKGSRLLPNGEQISQVLEAVERKAGEKGIEVLSFDGFNLGKISTISGTPVIAATTAPLPAVAANGGDQPPPSPQPAGAVYERVVEGELQGNHQSLVSFLQAISYYERITEVRAISAVKDEKTGRERLKFVLAAYYLPKQIEVPDKIRRRALEILKKENFDMSAELISDAADNELQKAEK